MNKDQRQESQRGTRGTSAPQASASDSDDFGAGVVSPAEAKSKVAPPREEARESESTAANREEPAATRPRATRSRRGGAGRRGARDRSVEPGEDQPEGAEAEPLAETSSRPAVGSRPSAEHGESVSYSADRDVSHPAAEGEEDSEPLPQSRDVELAPRPRRSRRGGRGRARSTGRGSQPGDERDEEERTVGERSDLDDARSAAPSDEAGRGHFEEEGYGPYETAAFEEEDAAEASGGADTERSEDGVDVGSTAGESILRRRRRRGGRRRRAGTSSPDGGFEGRENEGRTGGESAENTYEREFDRDRDPAGASDAEDRAPFDGDAYDADASYDSPPSVDAEYGPQLETHRGGRPLSESESQRRRRRRRRKSPGDTGAVREPRAESSLQIPASREGGARREAAPESARPTTDGPPRRERDRRRADRTERGGPRRTRRDRDRDGRERMPRDREQDFLEEDDEDVLPAPQRNASLQRLVINCVNEEESRVALVADGVLDDIQVNVRSQSSFLGNIYKGRVVNLEPSIGAAFVDFGVGKNGFLHVSDVMPIYGREGFVLKRLLDPEWAQEFDPEDRSRGESKARLNITEFLKKGQEVLVQITKDGIGEKGPTLTTYVSIPGRYLVLMPSLTRCGVSRKIEDERERRRLRRILKDIETPPGMGVIVRTAGSKRAKEEIHADLEYLLQLWKDFSLRLATGRAPKELYEESDVALRTIRDVFTPDVKEIAVDDEPAYERIRDFMNIASPMYVDRVKLYKGPTPIFHAYGVESQLEQLFARKVELPTGGSIVIDQAEALVAIDVNSGKSKESGDLEQTALRTNLAAIPEITRQMRLRDLGGIVVIDFIDMLEGGHRRQVERAFRAAIANDRARTKLSRISQFGLLEMTRQRLGPGLKKTFFEVCPHCSGMGHIKTPEAQSLGIIRDIQAVLGRKGFQHLEVKVRPEVEEFLANQKRRDIFQLEDRYEKRIRTVSDYRLPVGQVHFRFLTEDGREVRPAN